MRWPWQRAERKSDGRFPVSTETGRAEQDAYCLNARDQAIVAAAVQLLEKINRSSLIRPAQAVSVGKALRCLKLLPRASGAEMNLRVSLTGPRRWFGEHEIYHGWDVEIAGYFIRVGSSGHFYRKSTGGGTFTFMQWRAQPGVAADYLDCLDELRIVNDAQPFPLEVAGLDLTEPGFSLEVEDEDNPSLGEMETDEEEFDPDAPAVAEPVLREPEERLAGIADEEEGRRRGLTYLDPSGNCDMCGRDLAEGSFFVDGRLRGQLMFGCLCGECFFEHGEGLGWGAGQLYKRQPDGKWLMVAGFPPEGSQC